MPIALSKQQTYRFPRFSLGWQCFLEQQQVCKTSSLHAGVPATRNERRAKRAARTSEVTNYLAQLS